MDGVRRAWRDPRSSSGGIAALDIDVNSGGAGCLHTKTSDGNSTSGAGGPQTSSRTPATSHGHAPLDYGIFESTVAAGVTVAVNGVDRTTARGGPFDSDQTELEISQWLNVGAWNTIDLTPGVLGWIIGHLRVTGFWQTE